MTDSLHIAEGLSLPIEVAGDTTAILARKGAGKTYTALVLAEELVRCSYPMVMLDPMGVCWGLRASADGKHEGLPVTILGGEHGDLPLLETAGRAVADLVVEQPSWYVLDLTEMERRAQDRFVLDFAKRLYAAKAPESKRDPVHLVVDEAQQFAPQNMRKEGGLVPAMLGAMEIIARQGRVRGIGSTWITQRPATLNKNVLTQAEVLICLQITSPQDRAAVTDWAEGYIGKKDAAEFALTLARLKRGEAWVWSPSLADVFEQVRIRARRTFDSSATPKPGERRREPARLAAVDRAAIEKRMAETVEKAKADDPVELRRQLAELRKELREAQREKPSTEVRDVVVERPFIPTAVLENVRRRAEMLVDQVASDLARIDLQPTTTVRESKSDVRPRSASPVTPIRPAPVRAAPTDQGLRLGKAERAVLTALAQYPDGLDASRLAIVAGYAPGTGAVNNAVGAARSAGRITPAGTMPIRITDQGLADLGKYEPLPEPGPELVRYWLEKVRASSKLGGKAGHAHLQVLVDAWPDGLPSEVVAEKAGYTPGTGASNNALGRLRTLKLIEGYGVVRVARGLVA